MENNQPTVEQLAEELKDQRIESRMQIYGKEVGSNLYWLSRKHIAEDLLDKYDITPKKKEDGK